MPIPVSEESEVDFASFIKPDQDHYRPINLRKLEAEQRLAIQGYTEEQAAKIIEAEAERWERIVEANSFKSNQDAAAVKGQMIVQVRPKLELQLPNDRKLHRRAPLQKG